MAIGSEMLNKKGVRKAASEKDRNKKQTNKKGEKD